MIRFFMVLLFVFFTNLQLFCGIEEFFKMPTNTSGNHRMRNIDFIYTINLDQRPEKFATCTKQLHPLGIFPYRFSAVNGWELSLETLNKIGVVYDPSMEKFTNKTLKGTCFLPERNGKAIHEYMHVPGRTYFSHCLSRGAIGIVLSHLSILQHAYDSGFKTIWVTEDDIDLIQDPRILPDLIDKLDALVGPQGWDILFTDQDTKNNKGQYVPCTTYAKKPNFAPAHTYRFSMKVDVSPDFRKIGARYGAYSMIIRRSGMKKILDFIKTYKIFLPYDMEFYLPNDISMYCVSKDVVSTQINAASDNGAPRYRHLLQPENEPQGASK